MVVKNPFPSHPGQILAEINMKEMGLNQSTLARMLGCSSAKINEIVNGKRGISPEFALELEKVIESSAEMWVRMQAEYDLWEARQKATAKSRVVKPASKRSA